MCNYKLRLFENLNSIFSSSQTEKQQVEGKKGNKKFIMQLYKLSGNAMVSRT